MQRTSHGQDGGSPLISVLGDFLEGAAMTRAARKRLPTALMVIAGVSWISMSLALDRDAWRARELLLATRTVSLGALLHSPIWLLISTAFVVVMAAGYGVRLGRPLGAVEGGFWGLFCVGQWVFLTAADATQFGFYLFFLPLALGFGTMFWRLKHRAESSEPRAAGGP